MQSTRSFRAIVAIAFATLALLGLHSNQVQPSFAHGTTETRLGRLTDWSTHDPFDPGPHLERARLFLETGRLDSAKVEVECAEALRPRTANAALLRAEITAASGDTSEALRELEELLAHHPDDVAGHRFRGGIWLALGDTTASIGDYSTALGLDPAPEPDDFLTLSTLLPSEDGLRVLDEAQVRLGLSVGLELRAIEEARRLHRWDDALRRLASLERFYARTEPLLELRAEILLASGNWADAADVAIDLAARLDRREQEGRSTPDDRARRVRATEILSTCADANTSLVDTPRMAP
ncbi:MAG: tetratricopeptide repeat protein [Candidatus Eisenbacteria bacterium]